MQKIFFIFLILSICSCTGYNEDIEDALRLSGKNRGQLEKVLKRYGKDPADSLKLRAAEFLIVNMPGKYSEYYEAPWNDVATVLLRWTSSSDKQLVLDKYQLGEKVRQYDITHISAEYLIKNIELSFRVWQEVFWGKDIPFDVFCEEILPYRVYTESLENWREKALASFADLYKSFREDSAMTTVNACIKINSMLPRFRMDKDFPPMNYSQLMASARGTCDGMAALAVFSMRALGIPVSVDYTQVWPDSNHGHTWNSVYDTSGVYLSFMGAETNPNDPHTKVVGRPASKIYRRRFSVQELWTEEKNIPPVLLDMGGKDVTAEYGRSVDLTIPAFNHPVERMGFAYLTTLYETTWNAPVGYGVVKGDSISFSAVGKSAMYLPVYYRDNKQSAAYYPFWLDDDGSYRIFRPDTSLLEPVIIHEVEPADNFRMNRMLAGRFLGANASDFSDAKLLHTIKEVNGSLFHSVDIRNRSKYKYLLYYSPEGSRCNIAEIEFYDEKGNKIDGTVIGTAGSYQNSAATREKAFDGDVTSFFDATELDGAWVGIELREPKVVSKIRFFPRTEGNYIYEGHTYELYYWDRQQWRPYKKYLAASRQLHINLPSDALFYLQNITTRMKGRYFYIENGTPKWP